MATLDTLVQSPEYLFSGHLKRKQKIGFSVWSTVYVVITRSSIYIFTNAAAHKSYSFKCSLLLYDKIQSRQSRSNYHSFILLPLLHTCPNLVFGCITLGEKEKWMREIHQAMLWTHNKQPGTNNNRGTSQLTPRRPLQVEHNDIANVYDDIQERDEAISRVRRMNMNELIDFTDSQPRQDSIDSRAAPASRYANDHTLTPPPLAAAAASCSSSSSDSSDFNSEEDIEQSAPAATEQDVTPSAPALYDSLWPASQQQQTVAAPCLASSMAPNDHQQGGCGDAAVNSNEAYYAKAMFYGNRSAAFEIMRQHTTTGVFLVRVEGDRAVLTIRDGANVVKYVLVYESPQEQQQSRVRIDGTLEWFETLPHLLHHYHFHTLPNREVQLCQPFHTDSA